ncbi:MAG: hypothetical protein PHD73_10430 [Sediminibacterium sp.]|nr:hypothetical protein [Sediminibacterium sp.]
MISKENKQLYCRMEKWIIALLILFAHPVSAQNVFSGRIATKGGQAIAYASVTLRSVSDSAEKILAYCFSDSSGLFLLKIPVAQHCIVSFAAIGYQTRKLHFAAGNPVAFRQFRLVELEPEVRILNEVVVNGTRSVRINKDTIVADAESFAKGNERVLEDLLRKIPGIQVLEDGTVKVGNREVEKIMIEGDDFFEKSYRQLTRNMPPSPVSKIEILQHYSDNRLLKGIENSNKVALNLKLKQGIAQQWFGNIDAGFDCIMGKQYDARMNLIKLGKRFKQYWLGSMNNTGNQQSAENNTVETETEEDISEGLGEATPRALQMIQIGSAPISEQKRSGDQSSALYTMNSIWRPARKIRIKTGVQFNREGFRFNSTSIDSTGINQTSFINVEQLHLRRYGLNGTGKISATYDISEKNMLEYELMMGWGNATNQNQLLLNQRAIRDTLKTNIAMHAHLFRYSSRLSDKTVCQITARYFVDEAPQDYRVDQFNYHALFPGAIDADRTEQSARHQLKQFSVQAKLSLRPSAPSFIELLAGMTAQRDLLHTEFVIGYPSMTTDRPADYQNQSYYNTEDLFFRIRHRYQPGKISLIQQLGVHAVRYSYYAVNSRYRQAMLLINPGLGVEWKLSEKNLILFNCSLNKRNSRINELYGNYLLNGYRLFTRGSGRPDLPEAAVLSASFTHGNWADRFFSSIILLYSRDFTAYGTNSLVTQWYVQQEAIPVQQNRSATITANLDYYLPVIGANIKLNQQVTYSCFNNRVNESGLRNIQHLYINSGLEIRSAWKSWLNFHVGTTLGNHRVRVSASSGYTDYMSFVDLHFRLTGGLRLNLKTERFSWGGIDQNNTRYYFCDMDLSCNLVKSRLDCTLSGRNLLNINQFRSYRVTDIGYSNLTYRLLPRYLLLNLALRL